MTISRQRRPKPELKIRVRERNKNQAKIPDNTACLSLWVGFGAVKTEVSKILHGFLAAVCQEKVCAGDGRIPWESQVCRGVYTHIPWRGRSLSVTSSFSYMSCFIERCWIMNWATKTSVLQAASLPLFYKMPLTNKCKSLELVSRRLRVGKRITQSVCWLLTPFLWHIQYKFCAPFSFISAGHWKSGYVPELFSSQRGLDKRGKIDFASGYGLLLATSADQSVLFVAIA